MDAPACSWTPFDGEPLLTASELHPGAELIGASGRYVLAEAPRPDDGWEPIVVEVHGSDPFWVREFSVPPAPDMRARDIDGRIVLLCGDVDCQLFTIPSSGPVEELSGARFAAELVPRGVIDLWENPCVFGNGVHCFDDGAWLEVVPASGPRFHAAAATGTSIWAVGDEGRIVAATTECWLELPSDTDASLRSVSADSRDLWATAAGDDGVVAYVTLDETITCHVGGASWANVHRTWGQIWGYRVAHLYDRQWLLRADGSFIQGMPSNGGDWCTQSIGDEIREATTALCGIAENHIVVTPTALLGMDDCYVD